MPVIEMSMIAELSITLLFSFAGALCPLPCVCRIDELGRKEARCEGDSLRIPGTLDIHSLDEDVEVLTVSGSRQNPISVDLQADFFMNKRFKEIHLSFSALETLPMSPFFYVSDTLEILNLTHNRLAFVVEQNFRNLSRLTHLHLDHNRIEPVFSAMFQLLSSLRVLTMSNNNITQVPPRMALGLSTLEVLDMSSNPLGKRTPGPLVTEVPLWQPVPVAFFRDIPALRILRLSNTSLDGWPWNTRPTTLNNLEELDLANNRIRSILSDHPAIFRKLKVFRLAGNRNIHMYSSALDPNGASVRLLDLSTMDSTVLSAGVFNGTCIDFRDISNIGLSVFSRPIYLPISEVLRGQNISANPGILLKPQMFYYAPYLQTLSFKRLNITELPGGFLAIPIMLKHCIWMDVFWHLVKPAL